MTMSYFDRPDRTKGQLLRLAFKELSEVRLSHPVEHQGKTLPKGSKGTIVGVYSGGDGYEVEFFKPFHAVITLGKSTIVR